MNELVTIRALKYNVSKGMNFSLEWKEGTEGEGRKEEWGKEGTEGGKEKTEEKGRTWAVGCIHCLQLAPADDTHNTHISPLPLLSPPPVQV